VGGVFLRRSCPPAADHRGDAEANPEVNRLRLAIPRLLGADTIEVGRSLDTALQIRRRLAPTASSRCCSTGTLGATASPCSSSDAARGS
jgi:hypothetical protein